MTKSALGLALAVLFSASTAKADRVWYEYGLASATAGYDTQNNRTLIDKYYLGAVGPDSLEETVVEFIKECAKDATIVGVHAFYDTPGEVGAKVSAAYGAFKGSFLACVQSDKVAKHVAGKFYPSYIRRGYWEPGMNLKFNAENPSTKNYRLVHNAVKEKLPGVLNQAVLLYINSQELPPVDIKVELPGPASQFLKQLPPAPDLQKYTDAAGLEMNKKNFKLLNEVIEEPKKLPQVVAEIVADKYVVVPLTKEAEKAVNEAGKQVQKAGQDLGNAANNTANDAKRKVDEQAAEAKRKADQQAAELKRKADEEAAALKKKAEDEAKKVINVVTNPGSVLPHW